MGRLKGVPQTGRVAVERRGRAVQLTAHKEAIVKGTIASDVPEPLVPELFQDIQTVYWNCLKAVPDPRAPGQIVYPLYQILHRILAGFLTGASRVGVLFPRRHRVVAEARPGRGWRLCALPTRPAVYRLLRRVDWAVAQVALAPLWERLGYAPAWVMTRAPRDPKDILAAFRQAEAATAAQKAAAQKAARAAAEKGQGMRAAKACRPGRRVRSAKGKSVSPVTPSVSAVPVAETTVGAPARVPRPAVPGRPTAEAALMAPLASPTRGAPPPAL